MKTKKTEHTGGPLKVVEIYANNAPSRWGVWREEQTTFGIEPLAVFQNKEDAELFQSSYNLASALALAGKGEG